MTQSSTPRIKSFSEKLGMAPTATNPSTPSIYRFGPNRHQPALNAFTRIRIPDRRFTIGCPAGSFARAAEIPEAESANVRLDSNFDGKPVLAAVTEARLCTDGREEGESEVGESEKSESRAGREKVDGRGERTRRDRRARELEGKVEGGGRNHRRRRGCEGTEKEKKAVAVIARVLKEKFGPQIVREEWEEGFTDEMITDEEEAKGRHEEEEEGDGDEETEGAEAEGDEDQECKEGEDADAEASEENEPPTTSPPTRPSPPRNSPRVVSPSSLLSLYRFFSSHLGISSPSTVASLLGVCPELLRSDPTNDLLLRVHLLQSYGVSHSDISAITMRSPSWLRCSLPQIQKMLDFLLARGIPRTKLGAVLRRSPYLIRARARSTNLDILVEKAGVPVDKLGVIIERCPDILFVSEEVIRSRLELLSAYFTNGCEGGNVSSEHPRQHLNRQGKDKNHLRKLLVKFPAILLKAHRHFPAIFSLLQSFTPPDSPSVAIPILRQAPHLLCLSSQNVLAKLQYLVELVGKNATASVVRSHASVLLLSIENMQGKMALLDDLIGRGNAVLAVARFPLLLASNGENLKKGFGELVREVEAAMEESGGEENGRHMLEEGARKLVREVEEALEGREDGGFARESRTPEAPHMEARECAAQGGSDAGCQAGSKAWAEAGAEEGPGSKSIAGTTAREVVVNLVVKDPTSICYSWEGNTRYKIEYLKRDMGLSIKEIMIEEEEEGGSANGRITDEEEAKERQEEEEVGYGDEETEGSEVEEEDEEWKEGEDTEAEAGASDEDGTPATSPPTPPSLLKRRRVVSPSSLLSLYRFFSSHLGISSPSTIASLLTYRPALLRSDPTNDLLPRVNLLQSSPERIAIILSLLQSFTPPGSPSIAIPVLCRAPTLMSRTSQNLLAKLQYLEELVGKKAAASAVRSHSGVLRLSVENMQGKVALLGDLIGQENAVLAVAQYPSMLAINEENLTRGFSELVREVEEALEESGGEESGRQMLEEGARMLVREVGEALEGGGADGFARESLPVEEPEKDARKRVKQGESGAEARAGERRGFKGTAGATAARGGHLEGIFVGRRGAEEKQAAGEDVDGKDEFGVRKPEDQTSLEISQDSYAALGVEGAVAVGRLSQRGEDWQRGRKAVCLSQFLVCTDQEFEKRFQFELARKAVCLSQFLVCTDQEFEKRFQFELARKAVCLTKPGTLASPTLPYLCNPPSL
ncbi:unnamed protein product [Closterium sp. Naga37s-1]|nr:unnamed protein product [Closterium sp. Naga37s-1]